MKRLPPIKKIFKIISYGILSFIGLIFLFLLIMGFNVEHKDGTRDKWSGLRAIFQKDRDFGIFLNYQEKNNLNGIDGPYIIDNQLYEVTKENKFLNKNIDRKEKLIVKVDNSDNDQFTFQLKDSITSEPDFYELPEKLIVISDIEGNFDAFSSFLINNGIIDKNFNWTFGNGHLLLNGDFVDRGENVTQVLWLIYKLEQQALNQNGKVHYILGNHEIMNFQGNAYYANKKYKRVAQLISKNDSLNVATQFLHSDQTELGKWLRSKNVIEKIGNYIFVHAGLSPDILKYNVSVSDINRIARDNWDKNLYDEEENNKVENLITGKKGIYWYRGLAQDYKYYNKIKENELNQILKYYKANKIIFGHTVVEDITKEFNGKTINIDVKHGREKNSEKTKGLLIESGIEYKIDGKGTKTRL